MNTKLNKKDNDKIISAFVEALKPQTQEEKIQFEAEKIHLDFIFLLKDLMERYGINRKQLAEKLGVAPSYLTQLFRGDRLLNLKMIAKIQEVFDVKFKIVPARELMRYKSFYSPYKIDFSTLKKPTKTIAA